MVDEQRAAAERPARSLLPARLSPLRLGIGLLVLVVVGLPLAAPLLRVLAEPHALLAWSDFDRLLSLARNSCLLIVGVLALAMPLGTLAACLLYRTDLPYRRALRLVLLFSLFIPLPLFASGWQAVLGTGGLLPVAAWNPLREIRPEGGLVWTPWGQGLGSAIWIHALAGLPWVVLLVGVGLSGVEPDLEEDALTAAGPWRVLFTVSLRRAGAALVMAALWLNLQTAGEITVTDLMQVRTFAEEVYTQYIVPEAPTYSGGADGEARAVAIALPPALLLAGLLLLATRMWTRQLPPGFATVGSPRAFSLGRWRWPLLILLAGGIGILFGLPLAGLLWRAGRQVNPAGWSAQVLLRNLEIVRVAEWRLLANSLTIAVVAGVATAALGLAACWSAVYSRALGTVILLVAALAWAFPGPVLGLGLKAILRALADQTGSPLVARLVWYGQSPLPLLWIDCIRFFPCAVALLWPSVRLLPAELRESAQIDGARPWQELLFVIWPMLLPAVLRAALAVGVLSLGEVSAGKLVSTPGLPSYAETIFTQMHYGVTNDLAARCLWLLAVVFIGAAWVAWLNVDERIKEDFSVI